jgi:hypothetical protein
MRDIEQTIREVNGTMAMEGMPLTDEDKERLRDILNGKLSYETAIDNIIEKYTAKNAITYEQV